MEQIPFFRLKADRPHPRDYSHKPHDHTVVKKKKLNGPEGAKYFFPVERGKLL